MVAFAGDPVQVDVVSALKDANPGATLTLTDAKVTSGPGSVQSTTPAGVVTILTTTAGDLVVTYTVTNTDGGSASAKIRVTVTDRIPANPPLAVNDQLIVASGGAGQVNLILNDQGINDPNDSVSVTLNNRPPASFGTVELTSTGLLTFFAATNVASSVDLSYTLSDGSGQTSTAKVTISVLACEESPPSVNDNINLFTPYRTPISINLGDYVTAGSIRPGSPTGAGLNGATSGVYTPPAGMNGTEAITYVVENGCHQSIEGHVSIDVNRAPVATTITRELPRNTPPLVLSATDLASDDEPLSITSLTGNPAWVTLVPAEWQSGFVRQHHDRRRSAGRHGSRHLHDERRPCRTRAG